MVASVSGFEGIVSIAQRLLRAHPIRAYRTTATVSGHRTICTTSLLMRENVLGVVATSRAARRLSRSTGSSGVANSSNAAASRTATAADSSGASKTAKLTADSNSSSIANSNVRLANTDAVAGGRSSTTAAAVPPSPAPGSVPPDSSFWSALRAPSDASGATIVANTGSTARDHLANERTFLAWTKLGVAFVTLGLAMDSVQRVVDTQLLHGMATDDRRSRAAPFLPEGATADTNLASRSEEARTDVQIVPQGSKTKQASESVEVTEVHHASAAAPAAPVAAVASTSETTVASRSPVQNVHRALGALPRHWREYGPPLGAVSVGAALMAYSTQRYFHVQRELLVGNFPVHRHGVAVIVAATSLFTISAASLVEFNSAEAREKQKGAAKHV